MVNIELETKIAEWQKWDRNPETKAALAQLLKKKNYVQLEKIMMHRITFGTAGLRGKMALGYSNMNDLVVIQTAQGWLKYLEVKDVILLRTKGIVIGYDGRHNSRRWAEFTAAIFAHAHCPVKLFGDVCPTPFISYAIGKYGCAGGVMVTASHNPKEDNGYKVYDSNACQIIDPVDAKIQCSILRNLQPLEYSWDTSIISSSLLITDPLPKLTEDYTKLVVSTIIPTYAKNNQRTKLPFTYTAMHGVGYKYIEPVLDAIGINIIPVEEQKDPDPDFSTVQYPNPEEGEGSLNLAIKAAEMNGHLLIIANDPDADRFAFAEKNISTGKWKIFTGNELGALFGWWMLHCYEIEQENAAMQHVYMLSSTVSSRILKIMANVRGFNAIETLTGFKWMGNKALELRKQGKTVLFAFEVDIGFMCVPEILDKDGISAAAHFTTLCSFVYSSGKQIVGKLEELYNIFGHNIYIYSYYLCNDRELIRKIFERIRNYKEIFGYPPELVYETGSCKILSVRDLTTGCDSGEPDGIAKLPKSPEMITFRFEHESVFTLRSSGTEPKIKYYAEVFEKPDVKFRNRELISGLENQANDMLDAMLELCLQPKLNKLQHRED